MKFLPNIDLASLPELTNLIGVFGSGRTPNPGHDDRIVIIATIVYESTGGNLI